MTNLTKTPEVSDTAMTTSDEDINSSVTTGNESESMRSVAPNSG